MAVRIERVRRDALLFARHLDASAAVGEMERLHDLASLMRSHPDYRVPEAVNTAILAVIESGNYRMLE